MVAFKMLIPLGEAALWAKCGGLPEPKYRPYN